MRPAPEPRKDRETVRYRAREQTLPVLRFHETGGIRSPMKSYATNTKVKWSWGNGEGIGKVRGVFHESVTRTLKGSEITRNGSDDDPAYLVEQEDGDEVLKLHSELEKAT